MAEPVSATDLLLGEGVVLLAVALALVLLFRRLGLGATLGYLVAGALVGPHGLGLVGGGQSKMAIAEVGIVLLLFLVGLELNPQRLWRLKRDIFGLGALQVIVCGIALLGVIYAVTDFSLGAAIALGLPLALSSTAQVLPSLKASGRINSPFGEKAFSILLLQDLAIVPMITIIASLSRAPAPPDAPPGWMLALYTLGAIVALVLAGRFVLRPLLRLVGRLGERELFVAVGLFAVLASAALMHALHLSTALGAFIAGVMLADSPYRHEIESDVEPFRTILLGLFFVAVGMVLDLDVIRQYPVFIIGMALALGGGEGRTHRAARPALRHASGAGARSRLAVEPGRRVRFRAVRAGAGRAAYRTGRLQHVQRRHHALDGHDPVPADDRPPPRILHQGERGRGSGRPRSGAAQHGDHRGLWPFWPDGRADADGAGLQGYADRQEARADRAFEPVQHQGLLWRWTAGRPAAARGRGGHQSADLRA